MLPFAFTTTSHVAVTATLAVMVISIVIGYGFYKNGLGFLNLFAPPLGDMHPIAKFRLEERTSEFQSRLHLVWRLPL